MLPTVHQSLLAGLEGLLGSRYVRFSVLLAVGLVLLLLLAAYAQGARGHVLGTAVWSLGMSPTMIVYILLVHPPMRRRWQQAMESLHALAPTAGGAVPEAPVSHRGEWLAMLVGAVFGLVVAQDVPGAEGWLRAYSIATSVLVFALLAGVIYGGLARTRHLAARSRAGLELDVFDAHLLTPFARWGQSLSLAFVGGISLSLLFQSYRSLHSVEGLVIYGSLIIVALTLFFMSVWTIHVALAKAQKKELDRVRRDLAAARELMHRHASSDVARTREDFYLPVVVCGIYEKQVSDAPTWPFNPTIVRQLLASVVAPLCVYGFKLALGLGGGL